jgi:CheY-like chemotaxis protein
MANVLLVDDNTEIGHLLASALRRGGHEVRIAASGGQGLAMHKAATADIFVMDLCTPGVSGADAIERLRDGGDDTPIVAMSGACRLLDGEWPPRTAMGTALEAGADAFLAKPFTSKSLLMTLGRLLDQKKTEAASLNPFCMV